MVSIGNLNIIVQMIYLKTDRIFSMSEIREYEVEIEFEGRIFKTFQAENAEDALQQARTYRINAQELSDGLEEIRVDPWERINEQD